VIGVTQVELAKLLGVSEQAVQKWEGGLSVPTSPHLKDLIALAIQQHAFTAGQELEEAHALWKAARLKALFDEQWFRSLLTAQTFSSPALAIEAAPGTQRSQIAPQGVQPFPRIDWGEAF
jgi:transcriptional regulator with XRE-family HTH domain